MIDSPTRRAIWLTIVAIVTASPRCALAQIPPALATAIQHLQAERSYSWEVINADPGPVAQTAETRRGRVNYVQQNLAPHIKGKVTSNGEMLLQRDWSDGLQLDTLVTADGQTLTCTPDGWLTSQEVLTSIAEERSSNGIPSPRYQWLRRADRPDTTRPDQELPAAVKAASEFEAQGGTYVARIRFSDKARERAGMGELEVTLTINLRGGVVRDYQMTVQGSRTLARSGIQLPVGDDRFVILTYLPVRKLDVPDEAWAKLKSPKATFPR